MENNINKDHIEGHLRFIFGIGPKDFPVESELLEHPMEFFLGEDEDGKLIFEANFGPNPPDILIKLHNKILKVVDKIEVIGNMDPIDIEKIVGQQFLDVLGKPDFENDIVDDGIKKVNLGWTLPNGGTIFKLMQREATKEENLDKETIEYQEYLLSEALKVENYKKAIKIRDKIRTMNKTS